MEKLSLAEWTPLPTEPLVLIDSIFCAARFQIRIEITYTNEYKYCILLKFNHLTCFIHQLRTQTRSVTLKHDQSFQQRNHTFKQRRRGSELIEAQKHERYKERMFVA